MTSHNESLGVGELAARLAAEQAQVSKTTAELLAAINAGGVVVDFGSVEAQQADVHPAPRLFAGLPLLPKRRPVSERELSGNPGIFEQRIHDMLAPFAQKLDDDFFELLRRKPLSWRDAPLLHRHNLPAEGEVPPMKSRYNFEYAATPHQPPTLTRMTATQYLQGANPVSSSALTTAVGFGRSAHGIYITDIAATWRSRDTTPILAQNFRATFGVRESGYVQMLDTLASDSYNGQRRIMRLARVSIDLAQPEAPTLRFGSSPGYYSGFNRDDRHNPLGEENSHVTYKYNPPTGIFERQNLTVEEDRDLAGMWWPAQLTEQGFLRWLDFTLNTLPSADTPPEKRAVLPA